MRVRTYGIADLTAKIKMEKNGLKIQYSHVFPVLRNTLRSKNPEMDFTVERHRMRRIRMESAVFIHS